jgi:predicted DNA-binding transcriptional regulator AlpA
MGEIVDVDDLIGPAEVAEIIGLSNRNAVSVYRKRYTDFPVAVIDKGHCVLWRRTDIERWAIQG